jgi:hypothetical protein
MQGLREAATLGVITYLDLAGQSLDWRQLS